jgi:Tol biopolymer transport system component
MVRFTGLRVLGLSPDGKYIIFTSNNYMVTFGFMIDMILTGDSGKTYIMDIENRKAAKYVEKYEGLLLWKYINVK